MTRRDRWKKRPTVLRYHAFCDEVRARQLQLPIPYKVTFHIQMPVSWSKKKRIAMDGMPHRQKPDKDNLEKALLDAVYYDDASVWSGWAEKRWAQHPGIEIRAL